jgi:glycosyltransferase involved in cell wall biosynthesis
MTDSSGTQKKLVYVTAGAAGMYCGSCMHDNMLVRGLMQLGVDAQLIPTYTPIRTDEENVSVDRVFFGGINVFLEQKLTLYRHVSPLIGPLLDQPWLIRWAARWASKTDPATLGSLTVSMLRGEHGRQKAEVAQLCRWIADSVQPHIVQFSNMLIGGCIPALKARRNVPVVVTLQGDDIFLEGLPEPYRTAALNEIHKLVTNVDAFLVHSRYYAGFMADYFRIPPSKIHQVPLGIDLTDFVHRDLETTAAAAGNPRTIGYLARIAPEKGFHLLVDAYLKLRQQPEFRDVRLRAAGWLAPHRRDYLEAQRKKLRDEGCDQEFQYLGSVDRRQKVAFLRELDVLSVPTTYRDPKGIFVLEALAAGVPVVQPAHGAFPELVTALSGGRLVPPEDVDALAATLGELLNDDDARRELAEAGRQAVFQQHAAAVAARATWQALERFLG